VPDLSLFKANVIQKFLLCIVFLLCVVTKASARPIYVYQQADGSKKFSTQPPPSGTSAKVFTARKSTFSWYNPKPMYGGLSLYKQNKHTFDAYIKDASLKSGIEYSLIKAVIHAESGFNPKAISPKGARGLMQLLPSTAKDMGVADIHSPTDNIAGGTKYLKLLLKRYNGDTVRALAAYNAGMDWVDKYKGVPPFEETQKYVKIVARLRDRYSSDG
jgi:soluble lytic murein transglycosylase-like protein